MMQINCVLYGHFGHQLTLCFRPRGRRFAPTSNVVGRGVHFCSCTVPEMVMGAKLSIGTSTVIKTLKFYLTRILMQSGSAWLYRSDALDLIYVSFLRHGQGTNLACRTEARRAFINNTSYCQTPGGSTHKARDCFASRY